MGVYITTELVAVEDLAVGDHYISGSRVRRVVAVVHEVFMGERVLTETDTRTGTRWTVRHRLGCEVSRVCVKEMLGVRRGAVA